MPSSEVRVLDFRSEAAFWTRKGLAGRPQQYSTLIPGGGNDKATLEHALVAGNLLLHRRCPPACLLYSHDFRLFWRRRRYIIALVRVYCLRSPCLRLGLGSGLGLLICSHLHPALLDHQVNHHAPSMYSRPETLFRKSLRLRGRRR